MAKLIINGVIVNDNQSPAEDPAAIAQLVSTNYPEGSTWKVVLDSTEISERIKSGIQRKVIERYGVHGNPASAALSIVGKVGDATSLAIDDYVHQKLATEETKTTDYSKAIIRLFEEQHGEGSWAAAIEFALQWHEGRKSGAIAMPFDSKGIAEVVQENADLGGYVNALIKQLNAASPAS